MQHYGPVAGAWGNRMMVSAWWVVLAFLGGTYAGVSLMSMMFMASRPEDDAGRLPETPGPAG